MANSTRKTRSVHTTSYAIEAANSFYKGKELSLTERKAFENDGTMVTVICITYKHEEFIAQALDSFLMQKTDFKFKIFVGEDKGPDHTADIVREYAEKYPDIIVPFIRKRNMGAQRNLIDLCQRATSPYIAFCEGDDYWSDPYKLQKQVDYMEKNKSIRVCTMKTKILAPEDWHLKSWYKPTKQGEYVIPDSIPGYSEKKSFSSAYIIKRNVAHTSTHFYRWNYDLPIPKWYYQGIIGDTPLLLLQLGGTDLGFIPQIGSVYRINEGSAFFERDREKLFLRTRCDYIRYLCGLRNYAKKHFEKYPIVDVENRIKLETANYLKVLVKNDDQQTIAEFFNEYRDAGVISLNAFISFYNDQRTLTDAYTWEGYKMATRNAKFRHLMKPVVQLALRVKKKRELKAAKRKKRQEKRAAFIAKVKRVILRHLYWSNTKKKKKDNLWIFAGFNKKTYMDNSKYFYEYVIANHPEIKAYWITMDDEVYTQLQQEGKPVLRMRTKECRKIVSKAAIAVIDHFRMSDIDILSGLNDNLKIVQLWHGVGLKSIGDLKNTDVKGVQFSKDILPQKEDTPEIIKKKEQLYRKEAPFRELFEKYFMLVCPGEERELQIADPWNIPRENCFLSGHPRNIYLHTLDVDKDHPKILYAPTYRWEVAKEQELVNQIVESAPMIQEAMEQCDGEMVIRLHPHTWRNYSQKLDQMAATYDRIKIDGDKDVYKTLGGYSIIISDYSSIAYDFVLLDRPVVFFNYDYSDFVKSECKMNYNYNRYSPGVKTKTWAETIDAVKEYLADPEKDGKWRRRVRDEFYDMSVNDENNSERIVEGIKEKLAAAHPKKKR